MKEDSSPRILKPRNLIKMKVFSLNIALCAVLFAASLMTGCATRKGTLVTSSPETNIYLSTQKLEKNLEINGTKSSRVNGLLRVQIDAYNKNKKELDLEYRFRWLGQNGIEVDGNVTLWKPKKAEPTDNVYFTAVAPTPEAVDYEFYVRLK